MCCTHSSRSSGRKPPWPRSKERRTMPIGRPPLYGNEATFHFPNPCSKSSHPTSSQPASCACGLSRTRWRPGAVHTYDIYIYIYIYICIYMQSAGPLVGPSGCEARGLSTVKVPRLMYIVLLVLVSLPSDSFLGSRRPVW